MQNSENLLAGSFGTLSDLVRCHAAERPAQVALVAPDGKLDYRALDSLVDTAAAALQRDGVVPGDRVAIVGATSTAY
ncbi:MAG TPA: AMP-binding protein, partial [Sphingopyxis sp.]|uniref:AMP-binding protein n=1 Tax=Sphingopyxis sp. TaxID=1908224 RepID=UPI002D1356F3